MNENIKSEKRYSVASVSLINEVSGFAAYIARKYNGSPEMLRAANLMFDSLMEASIRIEQNKVDKLDVNTNGKEELTECNCADCRAFSKFIEGLKDLGADVHVVNVADLDKD